MANKNEFDTWEKNEYGTAHDEVLKHQFSDQFGSETIYFALTKGDWEGGNITVTPYSSEQDLLNDKEFYKHESYMLPPDKNITDAKELVANAIKHFDQVLSEIKETGITDTNQLGETPDGEIKTHSHTIPMDVDEYITSHAWQMQREFKKEQKAEQENKEQTPEQKAYWATIKQRDMIMSKIEDGTSVALPNEQGVVDTSAARNIVNGTCYNGVNLLYLKEYAKDKGFPNADFVTVEQIRQAKQADNSIAIKEGEKGVSLFTSEQVQSKDGSTKYETKSHKLFNIAQIAGKLGEKIEEALQPKDHYILKNTQYGDIPVVHNPVKCKSSEPENYLAHYIASVSMGREFKVSKKTAAEFRKNLIDSVFQKQENGLPNPFKLVNICIEAGKLCKSLIKEHKATEIGEALEEQKVNRKDRVHHKDFGERVLY